jgi:hypothetical protein
MVKFKTADGNQLLDNDTILVAFQVIDKNLKFEIS